MPQLAVHLFGTPRVERDGVPVDIRRRKSVALLAYLAVTGGSHSRDALATLLWPEHDQQRARANLRVALATLNRDIGDSWLQADPENIRLHASVEPGPRAAVWVDVSAFRHHVAACKAHCDSVEETCPECLSALAEATRLYQDHFLAGFTLRDSPAFDEWQFFQSEALRSELAYALERLARAHDREGERETSIPLARRWLSLDSLHEPAHRLLMGVYARSGQRAAALRQYEECARVLREELGAEPGEETKRLYERIRGGDVGQAAPARADESRRPHNLPAQATGFVGRQVQMAELRAVLAEPNVRLVTLAGPGGVGKTRLGLQVAANSVAAFPGGVFFVSLAPVDEPTLVVPAIAASLGIGQAEAGAFGPSPDVDIEQRLQDFVRDKVLLLVLDNLEQVLPAGPQIGELLATAPGLKVLTTSRAPLQVYGEHVYPVPPMAVPDRRALPTRDALLGLEAVQLFVQRARAAKSGFEVTDANAPVVAGICTRLEGLPLAIELAAARVRLLPPEGILERLDDALGFLVGGATDVPDRHRTLRATIDWSYQLLDGPERVLFRRLAVFAGGCSLEAVEAVSDASGGAGVLAALQGLVDKNMLQARQVHREARFSMLETLRAYAQERLTAEGEDVRDNTRRRHAGHFLALAEQAEPKEWSAERAAWADRLGMEYDNLRVALAWAEENDVEVGLRLAGALGWFWQGRSHRRDGQEWLGRLLDRSSERADELSPLRAKALNVAGRLAQSQWRYEEAWALQQESIALWQKVGDARGLAHGFVDVATALYFQRDLARSRDFSRQAIDLLRTTEDWAALSLALAWHGFATWRMDDSDEADLDAREAIRLGQLADSPQLVAFATGLLGRIALHQDRVEEALAHLERTVALCRQVVDMSWGWPSLAWVGNVLYRQGKYERAAAAWEEALVLSRERMSAPGSAWIVYSLGFVSLRRRNQQQAEARFTESLALIRDRDGRKDEMAACLLGLAGTAARGGRFERAAMLLGAMAAVLDSIGRDLYPVQQVDHEWIAAEVRSALDPEAWAAAWQRGRAMTLEEAVAFALGDATTAV